MVWIAKEIDGTSLAAAGIDTARADSRSLGLKTLANLRHAQQAFRSLGQRATDALS